jgi:hypothetical protein
MLLHGLHPFPTSGIQRSEHGLQWRPRASLITKEDHTMQTVTPSDHHARTHRAAPRRALTMAAAAIVVAMGWYLFRPELLFISRHVHETFPAPAAHMTTASTAAPMPLSQGRFHGVAHATR